MSTRTPTSSDIALRNLSMTRDRAALRSRADRWRALHLLLRAATLALTLATIALALVFCAAALRVV